MHAKCNLHAKPVGKPVGRLSNENVSVGVVGFLHPLHSTQSVSEPYRSVYETITHLSG